MTLLSTDDLFLARMKNRSRRMSDSGPSLPSTLTYILLDYRQQLQCLGLHLSHGRPNGVQSPWLQPNQILVVTFGAWTSRPTEDILCHSLSFSLFKKFCFLLLNVSATNYFYRDQWDISLLKGIWTNSPRDCTSECLPSLPWDPEHHPNHFWQTSFHEFPKDHEGARPSIWETLH